MSGKMKRLRRTNNPLDRNTRNDINYNWDVLDATLSQIDTSDFETDNRFKNVESDIKKLEEMDDHLSSRIQKNRDDIDAMDLDLLIEQGNVAEQKGQVTKKQGDKAEEQGNVAEQKGKKAEEQGNLAETKGAKAKQQGDYAEEQGKYANEKAEYAAQTTSEIIEANEDLAKTKLDTVEATQKANKSADHAQQAGDKAIEQVERVQPIIDKSETVLKEVEQATDKANTFADYAKEQGDYAKDTADKVNKAHDDLAKLKEDTVQATDDAINATLDAIDATDKASEMAEFANTEGERAKERTDYLESLLPNIEGWEFKGEWENKADYEKHNIVTHNGSTYILIADNAEGNPLQDDNWHMLAQRGIDGEGAVQTVNKIAPDLEGNVDLGELATPDDVKDATDKTLEASKEYTDAQIKAIPEIDISHLETKEDATAKLDEAKQYTDEKLGDVDLSEMEEQIQEHAKKKASKTESGHVQIGEGLGIEDGILSLFKQANFKLEKGLDLSGLKPSDLAPVGFTVGLAEKDYISEITKYYFNFFGDAVTVLEHYELDKFAKLTIYGWEAMLTIAYNDGEWESDWSYQTVNLGDGLEFDRSGRLSTSISHIHLDGEDSWDDYKQLDVPNGWTVGSGFDVDIPGIEDWNYNAFLLIYTFNSYQMIISINGLGDYWINHFSGEEDKWTGWKKLGIDTSNFITQEHAHQYNVKTSETGTAFGYESEATGNSSVALGKEAKAIGDFSVALGGAVARGEQSFAMGSGSIANNHSSFAINGGVATAYRSFAYSGTARGRYSIAIGDGVTASADNSIVLGSFNAGKTSPALIIGNGSPMRNSNALYLNQSGDLAIQGEYKTGGADYAEMFEWEDGNPDNMDRVALAVTWGEGESIKLANAGDEIIGIVSATAAILGDNPMDWDKRFLTDQFGRVLRKEYTRINEDGEEETYEWFVENPEYDSEKEFTPRDERPEWDAIGLIGKLYWIDDGTLEVGDYATVGKDGMATKGNKDNGYRVMKRISKSVDGKQGIVKVFFK